MKVTTYTERVIVQWLIRLDEDERFTITGSDGDGELRVHSVIVRYDETTVQVLGHKSDGSSHYWPINPSAIPQLAALIEKAKADGA
jgi:hypothetical protein